jgi:hypothetical protein
MKAGICNLHDVSNNFFNKIVAELLGKFPIKPQTCPYKVLLTVRKGEKSYDVFLFQERIEANNYTVKTVDPILHYFPGLPSGDYKYVIGLGYGVNSSKAFEASFSLFCKMKTMNPLW